MDPAPFSQMRLIVKVIIAVALIWYFGIFGLLAIIFIWFILPRIMGDARKSRYERILAWVKMRMKGKAPKGAGEGQVRFAMEQILENERRKKVPAHKLKGLERYIKTVDYTKLIEK